MRPSARYSVSVEQVSQTQGRTRIGSFPDPLHTRALNVALALGASCFDAI